MPHGRENRDRQRALDYDDRQGHIDGVEILAGRGTSCFDSLDVPVFAEGPLLLAIFCFSLLRGGAVKEPTERGNTGHDRLESGV